MHKCGHAYKSPSSCWEHVRGQALGVSLYLLPCLRQGLSPPPLTVYARLASPRSSKPSPSLSTIPRCAHSGVRLSICSKDQNSVLTFAQQGFLPSVPSPQPTEKEIFEMSYCT
jgi:hypothetical protein